MVLIPLIRTDISIDTVICSECYPSEFSEFYKAIESQYDKLDFPIIVLEDKKLVYLMNSASTCTMWFNNNNPYDTMEILRTYLDGKDTIIEGSTTPATALIDFSQKSKILDSVYDYLRSDYGLQELRIIGFKK